MKRITPHLWYDKEAKEAAEFYTSVFKGSKIKSMVNARLVRTESYDSGIVQVHYILNE